VIKDQENKSKSPTCLNDSKLLDKINLTKEMKDKYKVHQQQNDNVGTNMYFDLNKAQYIFDQEKRRKHIQDTYEHILTNVSNFISSLLTYVYSHL